MTLAQVQQGRRDARDTLPVRVVQRLTAAYNKRDAATFFAGLDTVFLHDRLTDTTAVRRRGTPQEIYGWFADSLKSGGTVAHIDVIRLVEHGPYVVQLYDLVVNGKRIPSIDIFEVRHGKIVHEWEQ